MDLFSVQSQSHRTIVLDRTSPCKMMSSNFVLLPLCSLKHTVTLNLYGNLSLSSIFFLLSSGGTAADDGWHGGSDLVARRLSTTCDDSITYINLSRVVKIIVLTS